MCRNKKTKYQTSVVSKFQKNRLIRNMHILKPQPSEYETYGSNSKHACMLYFYPSTPSAKGIKGMKGLC